MRTTTMTSAPVIVVGGLLDPAPLTLSRLLDVAVVDPQGRVLVALFDVLAAIRIAPSAEILLVVFVDGSSVAYRITDVLADADLFVHLDVRLGRNDGQRLIPRLTADGGRCSVSDVAISSISALTFAAFVGDR